MIQSLISNEGLRYHSKDDKWAYIWLNSRKKGGTKQRIKEFISVLNIKIKRDKLNDLKNLIY